MSERTEDIRERLNRDYALISKEDAEQAHRDIAYLLDRIEELERENEMLRADKRVQEARDMVSTVAEKNTALKAVLLRFTCNCGPDREPDPDEHADYCEYRRARTVLGED